MDKLTYGGIFNAEDWYKCSVHLVPYPKGAKCPKCNFHQEYQMAHTILAKYTRYLRSRAKDIRKDDDLEDITREDIAFEFERIADDIEEIMRVDKA